MFSVFEFKKLSRENSSFSSTNLADPSNSLKVRSSIPLQIQIPDTGIYLEIVTYRKHSCTIPKFSPWNWEKREQKPFFKSGPHRQAASLRTNPRRFSRLPRFILWEMWCGRNDELYVLTHLEFHGQYLESHNSGRPRPNRNYLKNNEILARKARGLSKEPREELNTPDRTAAYRSEPTLPERFYHETFFSRKVAFLENNPFETVYVLFWGVKIFASSCIFLFTK